MNNDIHINNDLKKLQYVYLKVFLLLRFAIPSACLSKSSLLISFERNVWLETSLNIFLNYLTIRMENSLCYGYRTQVSTVEKKREKEIAKAEQRLLNRDLKL